MGVLLLFLYSVYRIRREFQREQGFTSLIRHELKTPLSVIQLASESLAGGFVTEKEDVTEGLDLGIKERFGLRLGADDYLVKPFEVDELLPGNAEEEGWLDLNQVWQYDEAVSTRTLYVHIAWLREKPGIRAEDIRL